MERRWRRNVESVRREMGEIQRSIDKWAKGEEERGKRVGKQIVRILRGKRAPENNTSLFVGGVR